MILGFQGVVQLGRFGLDAFVANLVGLAIIRELGPVMVGMICIGRAGSAYAAELGTMKASEEIDAISTMGLKPVRMLVIPKIVALVMAMPFLVIIGDLAGVFGGVVIGTTMTELTTQSYLDKTINSLISANLFESITKGVVFAFIIAAVGCFRGFDADRDAKGVGTATTSSVVTGIFLLVVADFFVTFTFPQVMGLIGVNY
jgi:phospholipid/cholesterol/gamma-HCH transport system permease protein